MEKMRFKSKTGEIKQTFLCELVKKFWKVWETVANILFVCDKVKIRFEFYTCSFLCREGTEDDSDI